MSATSPDSLELKAQALGGYITTKSGHHVRFQMVVNNVPVAKVLDLTNVVQDQGKVAVMLWRDY